jgi:hypothetical protein
MSLTMMIHTLSSPAMSTRLFDFFLVILVVLLLTMLVDYSNSRMSACSLDIAAQIKIMGEPFLMFTGLWFGIYVISIRLPSEKYKIMSWKKKI